MRRRVGGVYKLPRNKATRNFSGKLVRLCNGALHSLSALSQHQLGAVCLHYLTTLDRHGFGHDNDYAVSARGGNRSKPNTGISGGRLDNYRSFAKKTARLSVIYHSLGNSVFDRACRIEVFELCKYTRLKTVFFFNMCKLKKRGFADELIGGFINV